MAVRFDHQLATYIPLVMSFAGRFRWPLRRKTVISILWVLEPPWRSPRKLSFLLQSCNLLPGSVQSKPARTPHALLGQVFAELFCISARQCFENCFRWQRFIKRSYTYNMLQQLEVSTISYMSFSPRPTKPMESLRHQLRRLQRARVLQTPRKSLRKKTAAKSKEKKESEGKSYELTAMEKPRRSFLRSLLSRLHIFDICNTVTSSLQSPCAAKGTHTVVSWSI